MSHTSKVWDTLDRGVHLVRTSSVQYFYLVNFKANNIYQVYNRGNNRQNIFLAERNYLYFLEKTRKYISPTCDILAYVLMPNHFHFLIHANEQTEAIVPNLTPTRTALSEAFRLLLSSYSKGINKQEGWTGNPIQQKTKAKMVYDPEVNDLQYATSCFHYIHQNPLRAGLTAKWKTGTILLIATMRDCATEPCPI